MTEMCEIKEMKPLKEESSIWNRFYPTGFKYEAKALIKLGFPVIFTNLILYITMTECIMFCGRLSKVELSGTVLACSLLNGFGITWNMGMCSACDTLFSQAFGGTNKKLIGILLQRSMIINSCIPILLCGFFLNTEYILLGLGQDPEISRIASNYIHIFMPGLLFHCHFYILSRYLQNQGYLYVPMVAVMCGNLFNIIGHYIALYELGYRYEASAFIYCIAYFIMLLVEVTYIIYYKIYEPTWDGWKKEALFEWAQYCKLGIAGIGHIALEAICWDGCIFLAGIIGATELAAMSITFQMELILYYTLPCSLCIGTNIRVGQYLGAGNHLGAKTTFNTAFTLNCFVYTLFAIFLITFRGHLPWIFTNDLDVINMILIMMPYMFIMNFFDCIMAITGGALKGCGRQTIAVAFIFIGYYIIGVPISVNLAFVGNLGIIGLWIGILIGLSICCVGFLITVMSQNWEKQAQKTLLRLHQDNSYDESIEIKNEKSVLLTEKPKSHGTIEAAPEGQWSQSGRRQRAHIRTPSQPFGCSTEVVPPPHRHTNISWARFRPVLVRRCIQLICVFCFFLVGLIVSLTNPIDRKYQPLHMNQTNITQPQVYATFETIMSTDMPLQP